MPTVTGSKKEQLGNAVISYHWSHRTVLGYQLGGLVPLTIAGVWLASESATDSGISTGAVLLCSALTLIGLTICVVGLAGLRSPALVLHEFGLVSRLNRNDRRCFYSDIIAIQNNSIRTWYYG